MAVRAVLCHLVMIVFILEARADTSATRPYDLERLQEVTTQLETDPRQGMPAATAFFNQWCAAEPDHKALQGFHGRLKALQSLREVVVGQLDRARSKALDSFVQDILEPSTNPSSKDQKEAVLKVLPADQLYGLYYQKFAHRIDTTGLTPQQLAFLKTYYNAQAQAMIEEVMRLGQALGTAGQDFQETECYLLLIPLLHSPTDFRGEILATLPSWVLAPQRLEHMIDFCLLRVDRLDAAAAIHATCVAKQESGEVRFKFFTSSADKCLANGRPDVAVKCLRWAIDQLKPGDKQIADIRFRICDIWMGARKFALAAGDAGQIIKEFPDTDYAGKAMFIRIQSLQAQENSDAVLAEVDTALADKHAEPFRPDLRFYKWQALRRKGKGLEANLVLKKFLADFPQNARAAEMYYQVAVDCLAAQRYEDALRILEAVARNYPDSKPANQAKTLIEKLQALVNETGSSTRPAAAK